MAAREVGDGLVQDRPGRRTLEVVRHPELEPAGEPAGVDRRQEPDEAPEIPVDEFSNGLKLQKHDTHPALVGGEQCCSRPRGSAFRRGRRHRYESDDGINEDYPPTCVGRVSRPRE